MRAAEENERTNKQASKAWGGGGVRTYRLGVVLDAERRRGGASGPPGVERGRESPLHVGGDLRLELRRLEEGADEAVHAPLQAAVDEQDGGLAHELRQRARVPGHEGARVALQHEPAHLRVRRHHRRRAEQVRPEHRAPVPAPSSISISFMRCAMPCRATHQRVRATCSQSPQVQVQATYSRRRLSTKASGREE